MLVSKLLLFSYTNDVKTKYYGGHVCLSVTGC